MQVIYLEDGLRKHQWRSGKRRPGRQKANKEGATKQVISMGNCSLVLGPTLINSTGPFLPQLKS